jgi:hypothetical protein
VSGPPATVLLDKGQKGCNVQNILNKQFLVGHVLSAHNRPGGACRKDGREHDSQKVTAQTQFLTEENKGNKDGQDNVRQKSVSAAENDS